MKLIAFFKGVKSYFYLLLSANTFYAKIALVDSNKLYYFFRYLFSKKRVHTALACTLCIYYN